MLLDVESKRRHNKNNNNKNKAKYFQWQPERAKKKNSNNKKTQVRASAARDLEALRFKRRPDLMAFHQEHGGALAAHFLCVVMQALMRGVPSSDTELRNVDVVKWAQHLAELKELRDSREVVTLSHIIKRISENRLPEALDVCAQRVKAICVAKAPKGSWEKASAVELMPLAGASACTQSGITLTGLGSA